jgi:23S rRNA pseudouridine2605 synthase
MAERKKASSKGKPERGTRKSTSGKGGADKPKKVFGGMPTKQRKGDPLPKFSDEVRLNKYLSNLGICSRREADTLISTGVVSVNGEIMTELGYKVKPGDVVKYDGQHLKPEVKRYVLLNKPKDFVTVNDDALGRKTIFSLVDKACRERVYPVDKLDRQTTGLLLMTNDPDMAKKLNHVSVRMSQLFHVTLDKPFSSDHMTELVEKGIFLNDHLVNPEEVQLIANKGNREIGIRLRTTRVKLVTNLFEKMGYSVVKLDRLEYAGLTKKDLPRGNFRHLSEQEVAFLKMK